MESSLRERLERLIEHAASKTPCGEHYKCLLADLKVLLASQEQPSRVEEPRELITKWRYWAVHYKGTVSEERLDAIKTCADELETALAAREVGEGLREALQAIWNLARESEYNRIGKLPSNEWLNSTVQWWMTHGKELKDYDKPDFSWAALAAPAPKPLTKDEAQPEYRAPSCCGGVGCNSCEPRGAY